MPAQLLRPWMLQSRHWIQFQKKDLIRVRNHRMFEWNDNDIIWIY